MNKDQISKMLALYIIPCIDYLFQRNLVSLAEYHT